jgi:pimeloyl-ACP methyl ester carboxylesterase
MFRTSNASFSRMIRRVLLMVGVLVAAMPTMALEPLGASAPAAGQARGRIGERIKERLEQRGRGKREKETADETLQIAGLNVGVWRPSQQTRAPLMVFSHGFGGCHQQSAFLMEALADAGYLVVAPDHKDAKCGDSTRRGRPEEKFGKAEEWSDQTYADRRDDIKKLVETMRQDRQWNSEVDWSRVGLVGHSLGGYTVLGLAGGWPSWKMPGIKAVLALSPYCEPFALKGDLDGIDMPVMYQGGTRDFGITPSVKKAGGCYAKTSSPATFVEFEGAGHFAWTNVQAAQHDIITRYSLAFLDKNVRGTSAASVTSRQAGVTDLKTK